MKRNIIFNFAVTLLLTVVCACSQDAPESGTPADSSRMKMAFTFSHPSQSRATGQSFDAGDKVSLFVAEADKGLEIAGNTVNNEPLTFDGKSWSASRQLYWDKGSYNAYSCYPYQDNIPSISDYMFEVRTNQNEAAPAGGVSPYEQSDFLFASVKNIEASASPVSMTFRHIMSKLTVRLVKGEDYEGELPDKATVVIHNTVTEATIDLTAGVATRYVHGATKSITARQDGPTEYSAIIVPQRLQNRAPLVEVIANGVSFMYDSKFLFKPGVQHLVSLVLDQNPDQVKIEVGGEITNWK